jgi:hypothetical protein
LASSRALVAGQPPPRCCPRSSTEAGEGRTIVYVVRFLAFAVIALGVLGENRAVVER